MSIPHWDRAPSEWNRLVLGKFVMPGVWDIEFECKRQIDVKKAKGKDGGTIKDEGYHPPTLDLVGRLATEEDWNALQRIIPVIHPKKKGKEREVFAIDHPKARLLSINNVYVMEIRSPSLARGILTQVIRAIEYVPKPKTVKTKKPGETAPMTYSNDLSYQQFTPPNSLDKGP